MKNKAIFIIVGCLFLLKACTDKNEIVPVQRGTIRYEENSMDTAKEFKSLAKKWAEHYQNVGPSSNMRDFLNHPAYRKLVELGPPAIPYIIKQYKQDDILPWEFVLDEITGLNMIKDPNHFSPPEVKRRWLEWWKQQPLKKRDHLGIRQTDRVHHAATFNTLQG